MIEKLLKSKKFQELVKINNFNMLSLFSDIFNENSYTRLLAYLFNSEENHGLNQQFFRSWLKNVQEINFKLPTAINSTIKTRLNWRTHENRYIDMVIQVINKETGKVSHVIGLENKKFTTESENQLADYQKDINLTFPQSKKVLIYLTPKGHKGKSHSEKITQCPCINVSYNSLTKTCDEKFKTDKHDILTLIKHLNKYISYNIIYGANMKDSKKKIVNSISQNTEYKKAIEEIIKYYPTYKTIRNLAYENIVSELQEHYDHVRIAWVYPQSSNTPHEINFEIDDINDLLGKRKIKFYYMLYSNTPNPHIGNDVCIRLMAYCGDGYEYVKSSQTLAKKIKKASLFPESSSLPKQWKPWECLYSGKIYNLQDMGELDSESIVDIIHDCIEKTYKPLKKYIISIT